jgi:hypothetical protein
MDMGFCMVISRYDLSVILFSNIADVSIDSPPTFLWMKTISV